MGRAGAAVPAFGNHIAGSIEQNSTNLRIEIACGAVFRKCDGATHERFSGISREHRR